MNLHIVGRGICSLADRFRGDLFVGNRSTDAATLLLFGWRSVTFWFVRHATEKGFLFPS